MNILSNRFAALASCAALSAGLVATSTMAAQPPGPELYGAYNVNGTVICQPGSYAGPGGAYDVNIGVANFNPNNGNNSGVVALQQTQVYGSAINASIPFSVVNKSYDFYFSNTATTVTLNNVAYTVIYSNINNGIAGTVSGVAVDANGCARNFTMQRTIVGPPPAH